MNKHGRCKPEIAGDIFESRMIDSLANPVSTLQIEITLDK